MFFGKQKFDVKQLRMNKFIFNAKQLKMNKFINSMRQLIISTSNATLEVLSLHLWFLNAFKLKIKRSVPEGCPLRICKIKNRILVISYHWYYNYNSYHYYNCIKVLHHFRLIYSSCVAIDYCVLSFFKCKLTLISFIENNCKC